MDVLDLRAYQPIHHENLQDLRRLAAYHAVMKYP
jgi:hypothetical protein